MYLTQKHFNHSIFVALLLHLVLLSAYAINIQIDHAKILETRLYIKLGDKPNIANGASDINRETERFSPQPVIKSTLKQPNEVVPVPKIETPSAAASVPTPQVQSSETIHSVKPSPARIEKKKDSLKKKQLFSPPSPKSKPNVPPLVQNFATNPMTENPAPSNISSEDIPFVQGLNSRELEVEGVMGNPLGNRTKAEQIVITKYEQKLALWLQKNKIYPQQASDQGLEGDALVRLQIDRLGNIRFYELAEKTPHRMLDEAVIRMVERSDPVPPVPDDYPGEFILEFLLPVTFKLH